MGRPLKKDTIVAMNLVAETKEGQVVLGKQVGFNKYIVDEEAHKVVRLASELVADNDAVLKLTVAGEEKPILKVLRNLVQTADGVYAYQLVDGEVVFADADVSFGAGEVATTAAEEEKVEEEPKEEQVEE